MIFDLQIFWWHWLILGLALMVFELLAPGAFFLWIGFASLGVSGVLALAPGLAFEAQLLFFALFSGISIFIGIHINRGRPQVETELNQRALLHVGKEAYLQSPIVQGQGYVNIDDTLWPVQGPDLPAQTLVRITDVVGNQLVVEKV